MVRVDEVDATTHSKWPRVRVLANDNYCVTQRGLVETAGRKETLVNSLVNCQTLNVNCIAVSHVPFVTRQPQKKDIRPIV